MKRLRECIWVRMRCGECGDYDFCCASGAEEPSRCHHCGSRNVMVVDLANGATRRELPWISKPRSATPVCDWTHSEGSAEPGTDESEPRRAGRKAKLTPEQRVAIQQAYKGDRRNAGIDGPSYRELAVQYGVCITVIKKLVKAKAAAAASAGSLQ